MKMKKKSTQTENNKKRARLTPEQLKQIVGGAAVPVPPATY